MKDVVAQHQAHAVVADKLASYDESLRQSVGRGLFGILEPHPEIIAVPKQAPERRQVFRGRYDENLADSRQHQCRDGIIHHRLVIDGQQLLAHAFGDGVEARSASTRQHNSFHGHVSLSCKDSKNTKHTKTKITSTYTIEAPPHTGGGASWCQESSVFYIIPMPPMPPAGIAGAGLSSFFSAMTHSVVRNMPAIEAAFSRATRVTFAGSITPEARRFS